MRMASALASAFLCSMAAFGAFAQTAPERPAPPEAVKAAEQALGTLALLVTKENRQQMGFDSVEEVRAATLGVPLPEFMVRLDELQKFHEGEDPSRLLHSTGRLTFPVLVQGRTRSSVTLGRGEKGWEAVSYGGPNYIRLLAEERGRLMEKEGRSADEYLEVRVPALNLSFLGARKEGRLFLTPLFEDPRFPLKKGATLPAEEVFKAIQPAAREHTGLPS